MCRPSQTPHSGFFLVERTSPDHACLRTRRPRSRRRPVLFTECCRRCQTPRRYSSSVLFAELYRQVPAPAAVVRLVILLQLPTPCYRRSSHPDS
ncbi:hypothetical protein PPTG_24176 [Phytophthora nicotianae INRA-310]|uniref:Uncharacterized protein n=1 Tax=Phytophthora nicotianae (strain INRA-310) TaxID=761204 RepID=W2PKN6_PHYN3|nr:hypothetical protein PPTG_24176 [Phytophthora nicotianae INRA-310]ETN00784.1 hypothetical protein PPTG_24176 [Phytophthora nicotianae INRA-310]